MRATFTAYADERRATQMLYFAMSAEAPPRLMPADVSLLFRSFAAARLFLPAFAFAPRSRDVTRRAISRKEPEVSAKSRVVYIFWFFSF